MKFEDRIQLKLSDLTEELFEKIVAYGFCAPSGMDGPGGVIMIAEDGKSYQFYAGLFPPIPIISPLIQS